MIILFKNNVKNNNQYYLMLFFLKLWQTNFRRRRAGSKVTLSLFTLALKKITLRHYNVSFKRFVQTLY